MTEPHIEHVKTVRGREIVRVTKTIKADPFWGPETNQTITRITILLPDGSLGQYADDVTVDDLTYLAVYNAERDAGASPADCHRIASAEAPASGLAKDDQPF